MQWIIQLCGMACAGMGPPTPPPSSALLHAVTFRSNDSSAPSPPPPLSPNTSKNWLAVTFHSNDSSDSSVFTSNRTKIITPPPPPPTKKEIEDSVPERYISSVLYSRDIPFWYGTLDVLCSVCLRKRWRQQCTKLALGLRAELVVTSYPVSNPESLEEHAGEASERVSTTAVGKTVTASLA